MTRGQTTQGSAGRVGAAKPGAPQARRFQKAADRNDAEAERQRQEREAAQQKNSGWSSSGGGGSGGGVAGGSGDARRQGR